MSANANQEPWVTISQASAYFSVSRTVFYNLMRRGILPYLPIGSRGRRVRISDAEIALRSRNGSPPETT